MEKLPLLKNMLWWCVSVIRDAEWMTPARATAYRNILLVVFATAIVVEIAVFLRNGVGLYGIPIGSDFVSFWTASKIALSSGPRDVYNIAIHWQSQKYLLNDPNIEYTAFFYPPVFLLICLPLALLPYFWSLTCWLIITGYAYYSAVSKLAGKPKMTLSILAFPAVWINIMHGQNGFITAALFAGAASTLESRPVVSGLLFGSLIYKPHLLVMIPFALLAGRRWLTVATFAGTAITLCVASLAIFGAESWQGFLSHTTLARATMAPQQQQKDSIYEEDVLCSFTAPLARAGGL
jgi:hypothetical protein